MIIDLTKMPRSAWLSFDLLPLTLTPNPAEPESLRGTSNVRNSRVPSGVKTSSSSSTFYREREERKRHTTVIVICSFEDESHLKAMVKVLDQKLGNKDSLERKVHWEKT